jgi:hypothetical protein
MANSYSGMAAKFFLPPISFLEIAARAFMARSPAHL